MKYLIKFEEVHDGHEAALTKDQVEFMRSCLSDIQTTPDGIHINLALANALLDAGYRNIK